jgi:lysyl-tRNA synthetase, class II
MIDEPDADSSAADPYCASMRRAQLARLRRRGIDPYPARVKRSHRLAELADLASGTQAAVAGRCGAISLDGSTARMTLRDGSGEVEVALARSEPLLPELAPGDHLEMRIVRRNGALHGEDPRLLCKALASAPAQPGCNWEALLAGTGSPQFLLQRARFFQAVRNYFVEAGFVELDTPVLSCCADFDYMLRPFVSHFHPKDGEPEPVYLNLSPEYFMKRAIVAGLERIFQITRFFRDGDLSVKHNPEFFAIEWYEAYSDYRETMNRVEHFVSATAMAMQRGPLLAFRGRRIDLTPPWPRLTVAEAVEQHTGSKLAELVGSPEALRACLMRAGVSDIPDHLPWEAMFSLIMSRVVEPRLAPRTPVFMIDYPRAFEYGQMARPTADGNSVERFELFIAGLELCNGFSELNDPEEQLARFERSGAQMGNERGPDADAGDLQFVRALEYGLPPTGGVALGLDRLLMVLLDAQSVEDVMLFPYRQLPRPVRASHDRAGDR